MTRRAFTPLDGLLLVLLLVGNWAVAGGATRGRAERVAISSTAGTELVALPAKGERHLEVAGPLGATVVVLSPEGARVDASPCPHQLCVRAGKVSRPGAVVACLPNRVAVRLEARGGGRREGVDAVGR